MVNGSHLFILDNLTALFERIFIDIFHINIDQLLSSKNRFIQTV